MARYQWIGSVKMEIPERPDAIKTEPAKPQRKKAKATEEPMPEMPAEDKGE
jgi:hypothetical protein